ncbi:uncharacterized protein LOC131881975 isoform X3 [Tigriopus californicus]|uniref:uncharacterized protein LOC131881975 isoform X3 n=1 Tax=Tigriopus californicus TaxID=6832 RepID=UPI0027D9D254|nr:uncharacterized protein LOC131881975 isoform X3 [Tigriopus californicus]
MDGVSKPEIQVISALEYESLPDGACFNRTMSQEPNGLERRECHNSSQQHTSKRNRNNINNNINNNNNNTHHRFLTATLDSNMRVTRNAKYLGCFQVQAASQNGRADYVRKQLLQMKDSPEHSNVSITISLTGVQVTHQDEEVSTSTFYALRRISYATCEPSTCLMAFLAREPQAPLHLQHCHVFRAPNPEQAEDLNTLVGKAFRTAYAVQLSEERASDLDPDSSPLNSTYTYSRRCRDIPQSRSAESLLSGPSLREQDPIYECTDFVRESRIRMSDQTLAKARLSTISRDNLRYRSFHQPDMRAHPRLLPTLPKNVNHVETLISPAASDVSQTSMVSSSRSFARFRPIKPNTLPVLNCLFAALNNNDEDTPYCEVPPSLSCNNNHINTKRQSCTPIPSSHKSSAYLNDSSTANSESSGDSMSHPPPQPIQLSMGSNFQHLGKSKSAHLISSCDVYSEVADSMTLINRRAQRRSQNWSIDELRSIPNGIGTVYRDVTPASDSPSCQSSRTNRGHSSGFSSGEASCTNSSGTTPPPLNTSIHQLTLGESITLHSENGGNLEDSESILEEPELETAPWFQAGMPRDLALEVLSREPEGAFIVRESNSRNTGLALSVRVPLDFHPGGIAHYLVVRAPRGFRIKGCQKQFPSITSLLVHHSVMPEMLPCPLSLNRYNPTFRPGEEDGSDAGDQGGDYLDPDRDYDLIAQLREGLLMDDIYQ